MNFASKEILLKVALGDVTSFEKVYRYYFPRLYYFSKQYLLDTEGSKNVVQEVQPQRFFFRHLLSDCQRPQLQCKDDESKVVNDPLLEQRIAMFRVLNLT